ncbi:MAG: 50S ribosomal protein L5 [Candidatus Marinimicrobia bacterium]|nr:50S ribosomal protein L5 [Candidatus Neomarinimicrobiota bacterium]
MSDKTEYKPQLQAAYQQEVKDKLDDKFDYNNVMEIPTLSKITVSMGVGDANENPDDLKLALEEMAKITGQKPIVTKAKKDIADFGIRKGDPVGCYVTLRRERMWEFLQRLISIALPRVKDFSGLSDKSFDGVGNYSFGLDEQIVFPEINYETVDKIRGLNVTITTTAETDEETYELLSLLGFPFKKR